MFLRAPCLYHGEEPLPGAPPKSQRIKQPPRLLDESLLWGVPPMEPRRVLDPRDLVPELTAGMRRLVIESSRERSPPAGDASSLPPPPPAGAFPVNVDAMDEDMEVEADVGVDAPVESDVDADVDADAVVDAEVECPPELFLTPSMAAEGPGTGFAYSPVRREGSDSPSPQARPLYSPPPPLPRADLGGGGVATGAPPPINEDDDEVGEAAWTAARGGKIDADVQGWGLTRKRGRRRVGDRSRGRALMAAAMDHRVREAMKSKAEEEHKRAWAAWWGCCLTECSQSEHV